MKKELTFNDYETIREFTEEKYNNILSGKERPKDIAGFRYDIIDNKIYLYDKNNYIFELVPKGKKREEIIKFYFANPQTTGGYKKIYRLICEEYAGISRQNVLDIIRKFESYQLRKPVPVLKQVRPIITKGPFERWQMDLIILDKYAKYNKGYKYLLVVVDVFSKYTFIKILPDKEGRTIALCLSAIFEETKQKYGKIPKILTSDNGGEFKNEDVKELCKRYKIQQRFSHPYTPQEQGQVERRNQDIKNIIFKHFINTKKYNYIDIINQILYNINNNTINKTTGKTPEQVMRSRDYDNQIIENMKNNAIRRANKILKKAPLFKVKDKVRIAILKKIYPRKTKKQKEQEKEKTKEQLLKEKEEQKLNVGVRKWSDAIYTVEKIIKPKEKWQQPLYLLDNGEVYNPYMLQKVYYTTN